MCARGLGCCLHLRGDMLCSALPRGLGAPCCVVVVVVVEGEGGGVGVAQADVNSYENVHK